MRCTAIGHDLMGKENAVDDVLVTLIDIDSCFCEFSSRPTILDPAKEEDETVHGALDRLLQIVNLLDLYAIDAKIFEKKCEETCEMTRKERQWVADHQW